MYKVAVRMSSSEPLSRSDVLELDRAVREFPLYSLSREPWDDQAVLQEGPKTVMSRIFPAFMREVRMFFCNHISAVVIITHLLVLLYIHRNLFAKALGDDPNVDPMRTPYSASFLSAYRSSLTILQLLRRAFRLIPGVVARSWLLWHHSLSAAVRNATCDLVSLCFTPSFQVAIASVIALRPQSDLAPTALAELAQAVNVYEEAVVHSKALDRILVIWL